jgi:hypothetical protein
MKNEMSSYLDGLQAKVNELRELQSAMGEELDALKELQSV